MARFSTFSAHTRKWYETATKKQRKNIREIMAQPGGKRLIEFGCLEEVSWTCPGEDAGACDSCVRGDYEGPCEMCPLRKEVG